MAEELEVYFQPPLHEQRKLWIFDIIRRELIHDILDIGCGEGALLYPLCHPAPYLPSTSDDFIYLRPNRVRALDVSEPDLQFAVKAASVPAEKRGSFYMPTLPRWQQLSTQIWHGGLEHLNEDFVGTECIVASEVIEHLSPDVFEAFAPMLLGIYHPKFLLITTPSYTFNARFTAPDAPASSRQGHPDPTGRTDRIFRHNDHKFEWTDEELRAWSSNVAQQWGYKATVSNLGQPLLADPFERQFLGASQAVLFQRCDGDVAWRSEEGRKVVENLALKTQPHRLLAEAFHPAHPQSGAHAPYPEIASMVITELERLYVAIHPFEALWFVSDSIPVLCGGSIDALIDAINDAPDTILRLDSTPGAQKRSEWNVVLEKGLASPPPSWPNEIPEGWTPIERDDSDDENFYDDEVYSTAPPSESGAEGDISRDGSDTEDMSDVDTPGTSWGWASQPHAWGNLKDQAEPTVVTTVSLVHHDFGGDGWGSTGDWDADQSQNDWGTS